MSIHTSRVVIHTKNVNPVRSSCVAVWGTPKAATKCKTRRTALILTTTHLVRYHTVANHQISRIVDERTLKSTSVTVKPLRAYRVFVFSFYIQFRAFHPHIGGHGRV